MEVRLGDKTLGQHGSNIYYKEFFVTSNSGVRHYRPGRFYFVQKSKRFEIAIAEFQLIWHNLKDSKNYASVKLYFKPEKDFDDDEEEAHGMDEVVEASRQVVVECSKFAAWECTSKSWHQSYGTTLYDGVEVDKLKALSKNQQKIIHRNDNSLRKVKILNFPQYNRYKTCIKMLNLGVPMTYFQLLARGGLDIKNLNTLILFSKKQFEKEDVEDYSPTLDVPVPVFKGRPRKRKNIQNPFSNDDAVTNKKIKTIDIKSNSTKQPTQIKIDHKTNGRIGPILNKPIEIHPPPPVKRVVLDLPKPEPPPGRGVRGRDTICHEKREYTLKDKEEHHRFSEDLHRYMLNNGTPILKIPRIGCAPVNPLVLYRAVMDRGGFAQVTLHRNWRDVYDCLGHSTMITNAATATRKLYERMLLPYENHMRSNPGNPGKRISDKRAYQASLPKFSSNDLIRPREHFEHKNPEQQTHRQQQQPIVIAPKVPHVNSMPQNVVNSAENLSISLMMSKQRGRPSKKFRNQIEKLRSRQTMQLNEEQQHAPVFAGKTARLPPRKQPWVNELNVDIASRQHTEVPMSSNPAFRNKDKERRLSDSSDIELISPRRGTEIHSPLRQGRRIYPSTKDSSSSGTNGFVPDAFVSNVQNSTDKEQPNSQKKGQCEFKIQSVRSLATVDENKPSSSQQPNEAASSGTTQYVHYPYSTTNTYEYIPTKFYSLSDSNKLVPINALTVGNSGKQPTQKAMFRDAGFSMRTFRHDQSADNTSYKIKSTALKNHEPYIIHHPSHLNRGYREIPGQYPVIYTHQPGVRTTGKSERSTNYVRQDMRYVTSAPVDYSPPNGTIVYGRVQPRYEKISPRSSGTTSTRGRGRGRGRPPSRPSSSTTYVKYIDPPAQSVQKWPAGTELLKVKAHVNM